MLVSILTESQTTSFFEFEKNFKKLDLDYNKIFKDSVYTVYKNDSVKFKNDTSIININYRKNISKFSNTYLKQKADILKSLKYYTFPDMNFIDYGGKIHSLSEFDKQKIILNFNYTFCQSCINQVDSILKLKNKSTHLIVLLHDKQTDTEHIFEKYGDKIVLVFISQNDENTYTLNLGTPTTILLDENRLISYFGFDKTDTGEKELFQNLQNF